MRKRPGLRPVARGRRRTLLQGRVAPRFPSRAQRGARSISTELLGRHSRSRNIARAYGYTAGSISARASSSGWLRRADGPRPTHSLHTGQYTLLLKHSTCGECIGAAANDGEAEAANRSVWAGDREGRPEVAHSHVCRHQVGGEAALCEQDRQWIEEESRVRVTWRDAEPLPPSGGTGRGRRADGTSQTEDVRCCGQSFRHPES